MTDCPNTTTNTGGGPPVRSASPPAYPVQYKRVDRRYGKEEMLDLYTSSVASNELPEDLSEFSFILKDQPQEPLNFISITEEEQVHVTQFTIIDFSQLMFLSFSAFNVAIS